MKMIRKNVLDLSKSYTLLVKMIKECCEFAFYLLKKAMNEDKENKVVEKIVHVENSFVILIETTM